MLNNSGVIQEEDPGHSVMLGVISTWLEWVMGV